MTRHPSHQRSSSPAVQRARARMMSAPGISRVTRDLSGPGGVRVDLDIKVDELAEVGVDINETLPKAWVSDLLDDGSNPRWMGHGDAKLSLHLDNEASFVRVTGQGRFLLSHPCVRCLSEIPFDVKLDVDLRLVQRIDGPIEGEWGEGDANSDLFATRREQSALGDASDLEDLNIASYQDGVVRVRDLLREQMFLELPMHPACDSRDARPERECAFDENSANAGARADWTTSRWASLTALRDKLPPCPEKNEGSRMTPEKNPQRPQPDDTAPTTNRGKPQQLSASDTQKVMRVIFHEEDEPITVPGLMVRADGNATAPEPLVTAPTSARAAKRPSTIPTPVTKRAPARSKAKAAPRKAASAKGKPKPKKATRQKAQPARKPKKR